MTKPTYISLSLLILLAGCVPGDPDLPDKIPGDTDTDSGGSSSGVGTTTGDGTNSNTTTTATSTSSTSTSSTSSTTTGPGTTSGGSTTTDSGGSTTTDSGGSSTGEPDTCTYHCFSAPPVYFPYNVNAVDENGDVAVVPLVCTLNDNRGSLNLLGTSFPIDEWACMLNQTEAEVVQDQGVCNPGSVTPSATWDDWAQVYAHRQQKQCIAILNEQFDCILSGAVQAMEVGATEICDAYLRFQLQIDTESVSPQLEEVDPLVGSVIPGCGPYEDNLSCG